MNYSTNGAALPKQRNKAFITLAILCLVMSLILYAIIVRAAIIIGNMSASNAITFRMIIMNFPILPMVFSLIVLLSKKQYVFPVLFCGFSASITLIDIISDFLVSRISDPTYYGWWTSFPISIYSTFSLLFAIVAMLLFIIIKVKGKAVITSAIIGLIIMCLCFVLRTPISKLFHMEAQADLFYLTVRSMIPLSLCIPFIAVNMVMGYIIIKKRPSFYIIASAFQVIATFTAMLMLQKLFGVQGIVYSLLIGEVVKTIPLAIAVVFIKDTDTTAEADVGAFVNQYSESTSEAIFCSKCGTPFADGAAFCAKCGNAR